MSSSTPPSTSYEQDQKTRAQMEAIEKEIKLKQSLTSDLQPLSNLVQLYDNSNSNNNNDNDNNYNFIQGSKYLSSKYKSWRMIRGDGNCYYRAFLYAVCEELLRGCLSSATSTSTSTEISTEKVTEGNGDDEDKSDVYRKELKRLTEYVNSSIDDITKYGYDRFTIETFHEELVELFELLTTSTGTDTSTTATKTKTLSESEKELHTKLNEENSTSDYCTWYLRVLTSCHLKKDADRFIHYLDDPNYFDVDTFCKREVDPMGKECGMVQVLALAEALNVKVNIEYLDGREMIDDDSNVDDTVDNVDNNGGVPKQKKLMVHEFGPDGKCLEINLLYRPGHYDILYT